MKEKEEIQERRAKKVRKEKDEKGEKEKEKSIPTSFSEFAAPFFSVLTCVRTAKARPAMSKAASEALLNNML